MSASSFNVTLRLHSCCFSFAAAQHRSNTSLISLGFSSINCSDIMSYYRARGYDRDYRDRMILRDPSPHILVSHQDSEPRNYAYHRERVDQYSPPPAAYVSERVSERHVSRDRAVEVV